jgi:ribosomal protein S18 acetylase RimI-like enzyme
MIKVVRITQLTETLYDEAMQLWLETGISNPQRNDSFEAVSFSLQKTGTLIMAYEGSEAIGTAWLNHDFRRLYIHHMAVKPNRQNQGIGSLLMQEAIEVARELGYQAKLEVHRDNPAAMHLYKKFGFTELEGYLTLIKRNL